MLGDSEAMLINNKSDTQQHFDPAFEVVHHFIAKTRKLLLSDLRDLYTNFKLTKIIIIYLETQGGNYTWDALLPNDNSEVVAKVVNSVDSAQGTNNIPWQLNEATVSV
jgi:hypothetical protein